MQNDSSNDPRTIWQSQPTEPSTMTPEKIRQKIKQMHAKTRQALLGGAAVALVVIGIAVYGILRSDSPVARTVCILLIAWSLVGQYFLNRGMWSGTQPAEAVPNTGLESYRSEVERRRHLADHNLLWSFGPVVVATGTFILIVLKLQSVNQTVLVKGTILNGIPFLVLVVVWIVAYLAIRMRDRRELQQEIDQLHEIERTNR
jgi:hypothetical protein